MARFLKRLTPALVTGGLLLALAAAIGSAPSRASASPALTPVLQKVDSTPRRYRGDDSRLTNTLAIPIEVRIEHRLTVDIGPGHPELGRLPTSTGAPARVARRGPAVLAPPPRGGRWVAVVGRP